MTDRCPERRDPLSLRSCSSVLASSVLFAAWPPRRSAWRRADADRRGSYVRDRRAPRREGRARGPPAERSKSATTRPRSVVVFDRITFPRRPAATSTATTTTTPGTSTRGSTASRRGRKAAPSRSASPCRTSEKAVRVGDGDWQGDCRRELERDWWDDPRAPPLRAGPRLDPALDARRGGAKRAGPRRLRRERVDARALGRRRSSSSEPPAAWRRKLLPVGDYWDPEAIGSALAGRAARSWSSRRRSASATSALRHAPLPCRGRRRPQRPPPDLYGSLGADEDEAYDQMLREDLERDLAEEYPDPVEREEGSTRSSAKGEDAGRGAGRRGRRPAPCRRPDPGRGRSRRRRPGRTLHLGSAVPLPALWRTRALRQRRAVGVRVLAVRARGAS